MSSPVRVRIAPSPTGDPHVGTAYTGLFNWLLARKTGGQFLLRIEDTDRQRSTPESEQAIVRSLLWLGLQWDEGPDIGGPHAPYRQSERAEIYRAHAQILLENGAAYPCFATPEQLEEMRERQKKEGLPLGYDGPDRTMDLAIARRRIESGEPYTVRLRVDRDQTTAFQDLLRGEIRIENRNVDDQVLLKSDGFPTYHLANVVDDHLMGITHVLRAEEWISSTPKHVMLYESFGWHAPVFCHLPLLRNSDRSKISKRKNPTSLDYYLERGYLPEALVNFLALMGFSPGEGDGEEIFSLEELVERFDPARISLGGPVFDLTKLDWLNGAWIRRLPDDELVTRIVAVLPAGHPATPEFVLRVLPLVRERLKTLLDFEPWTDFFFKEPIEYDQDSFQRTKLEPKVMRRLLRRCQKVLEENPEISHERDEPRLRQGAEELGLKIGSFFMTLRVAITGKAATPPLLECMEILGRDRCLARLERAVLHLRGEDPEGEL